MRWWRKDPPPDAAASEGDVERAYEQGRLDERRRRRSHPIIATLVFLAAVVGVGMIYLAAREGSFTRGGELVDRKLASAADTTHQASQNAAVVAQNAGQTLRQNSVNR